jgi:CheY-like chemotaxis protein
MYFFPRLTVERLAFNSGLALLPSHFAVKRPAGIRIAIVIAWCSLSRRRASGNFANNQTQSGYRFFLAMIETKHISSDNRSTVLLIGDGFGILKRIAFALQHSGHSVIWGDSGQTGLRVAEREEPALIVCEIQLPDFSGIEVCRRVKASFFGETPVVLVGKISDEERDSHQAVRAGADDYLVSFAEWQWVMAKLEWLMKRRTLVWQTSDLTGTPEHVGQLSPSTGFFVNSHLSGNARREQS